MSDVDPHRRVALRIVADHDAPDAQPGDVMPMRDESGAVWGFALRCPGCNAASEIPLRPWRTRPSWEVTAGDPLTGAGLTLSPSIHHDTDLGGCGWHGHLVNGVFA